MSEYGYKNRPPMPDRFVTGGPAVPRNEWPNRLLKDFRDPADAGYTRKVMHLAGSNGNAIFGNAGLVLNRTNTGVLVPTSNGWASQYSRYGLIFDLTCNHATQTVVVREALRAQLIPRAFLDPSAPPFPGILRIEDVLAAETTTSAAGHGGGLAFGYSWENSVSPQGSTTPYPWIGFQVSWSNPDTYGEWNAIVIDAAAATKFTYALGVNSDTPHHFAMEFDGVAKQINWYVNDVLATAYAVEAQADIFPAIAAYSQDVRWHTLAVGNTSVVRSLQMCDMSAVVSLTLYDLDTV